MKPTNRGAAKRGRRVETGTVLGGFRLVESVGVGGMGEVWKAENVRVRSMVRAVKVIKPDLAALPDFRKRFLREAQYLDALQHPNILLVQNIAEEEGVLFMLMELLEGQGVDELLKWTPGKLPVQEVAGLIQQALVGVAHAHARGIQHRDLKPHNLFLTSAGVVKVLDFGIARQEDAAATTQLTRAGTFVGSPAYMAPEIAEGKQADKRADVYAMGITLYELVTGKLPFEAPGSSSGNQSALAVMFQHATKPVPDIRAVRPEAPEGLVQVIAKATAKSPDDRYADAGEFAIAIAPFAGSSAPASLARLTPPPGARRGRTPSRAMVVAEAAPGSGGEADGTCFAVPELDHVEEEPVATPDPPRRHGLAIGIALAVVVTVAGGLGVWQWKAPKGPLSEAAAREHYGSSAPASAAARDATPPVPAEMAYVPAGKLVMGRTAYGVDGALDVPPHDVQVGAFALQKAEVTIGEYKAFVEAGHALPPWPAGMKNLSRLERLPVVNVSHEDAAGYCLWKWKGRLPTEAEWEWAARGPEGRLYPWGNEFQKVCVNGLAGESGVLQPADRNPCGATPSGLLDMSGNAWEWTSSQASIYPGSTLPAPPEGLYVVRGGSFFNTDRDELTATYRQFTKVQSRYIGFRCAVDLEKR